MARYRLLAGWCREHGCLHLLTAHHREDQIETHLIRRRAGSGPDGLGRNVGDPRTRRLPIAAPAARCLEGALCRRCSKPKRQPFITDPSNLDPAFERARFRGWQRRDAAAESQLLDLLEAVESFGLQRAARQRETDRHSRQVRDACIPPASPCSIPLCCEPRRPDMAERVLSRRRRDDRRRRLSGSARSGSPGCARCSARRAARAYARRLPFRPLAGTHPRHARTRATPRRRSGSRPGASIWLGSALTRSGSPPGSRPLTIGYLGSANVARLDRRGAAFEGELTCLGCSSRFCRRPGTRTGSLRFLIWVIDAQGHAPRCRSLFFSPANPLTQAELCRCLTPHSRLSLKRAKIVAALPSAGVVCPGAMPGSAWKGLQRE